jgi:putative transcriptional regulator
LSIHADFPRIGRELRERIELTQEESAARLRVTFPTISCWENGKAGRSPLALSSIEEFLHQLGDRGRASLDLLQV